MTAEGTLAVSVGHMLFVGSAGKIEIRAPAKVAVVPVPIPWFGLGIGNALFLLYVFCHSVPHSLLTPDFPLTWALLVAINVLITFTYRRERWVEIANAAEKGEMEWAYFTQVSQLGWWPSPERVERLCDGIRSALQTGGADEPPPATPSAPATDDAKRQECMTIVCDDCGRENVFLAGHFGTVQQCVHCEGYLDVE